MIVVRLHNSDHLINATLKGEISEIDDYVPANVTYPSNLLHTCPRLQYLQLWNDERVEEVVFEMDECDGIEEVVSWRDEENTLTSFQKNTTFFPCLEILGLRRLKLLNRVDGGDTRIRQMNRLEGLEIINCETMMEVFESESNVDEGSAHVSTS
ncbi:hypothetical protein L1987_88041 [Smallanthus sonchifolius]|nr:hypothetical protein L1987_88041 [Smallanthus sonchifolius]